MNIHGSLFLGLFLAIQVNSFAQATKEKCRKIPASHQFEITDSLTIIPGSVRFIPSEGVSFVADADQGKIKVTNRGNQDSLEVCYRVIPYALNHYYHDRPMSDYDSGNNLIQWKSAIPKSPGNYREEIFHSEGLAKSGSLTRVLVSGITRICTSIQP